MRQPVSKEIKGKMVVCTPFNAFKQTDLAHHVMSLIAPIVGSFQENDELVKALLQDHEKTNIEDVALKLLPMISLVDRGEVGDLMESLLGGIQMPMPGASGALELKSLEGMTRDQVSAACDDDITLMLQLCVLSFQANVSPFLGGVPNELKEKFAKLTEKVPSQ